MQKNVDTYNMFYCINETYAIFWHRPHAVVYEVMCFLKSKRL